MWICENGSLIEVPDEEQEYPLIVSADERVDVDFWNVFQKNGSRRDYSYAFANWSHNRIVPLYKVICENFVYLLMNATVIDASGIDIECTSQNPSVQGLCMNCTNMTKPPRLTFTTAPFVRTWTSAFAGCESMTECEIDFGSNQLQVINPITMRNNMQNTFFKCSALKDITFRGMGSPKSLDLSPCINLSAESIASLSEHLYDVSSATAGDYTIKIASTTLGECDAETIQDIEALGWTIQSVLVENPTRGEQMR